MSTLEAVRESLAELESLDKATLLSALMEANRELILMEKDRQQALSQITHTNDRTDLYSRRCELALAILRDDELGLSAQRLQRIAEVIWPEALALPDPTQIPTQPQPEISNLLRASELIWRAHWFFHSFETSRIQLGPWFTTQLERWRDDANRWRSQTGVESVETEEIRARAQFVGSAPDGNVREGNDASDALDSQKGPNGYG